MFLSLYSKYSLDTNLFKTIFPSALDNQALQTRPHTERRTQICKQTPAKLTWGGRQRTTGNVSTQGRVSSKLAWGKETDSERTKLYLCRYMQLRSHHHTLVSCWPTPTAYQEEPMESGWKFDLYNCSSVGMSNACWRLSLEARGRMDVRQL